MLQLAANPFALTPNMPKAKYRKRIECHAKNGTCNAKAVSDYFHVSISDVAKQGYMPGLL